MASKLDWDKLIKFNVTIARKKDGSKIASRFNITKGYKKFEISEELDRPNYGFLCGKKSNVVVIDVDVKNGKDGVKALKDLNIDIDSYDTYTVKTRNGFHYYFKYNEKWNKSHLLANGIDILSNNSNCFAGEGYEVINNTSFKELTEDLYRAIYPVDTIKEKKIKKKDEDEKPKTQQDKYNDIIKQIDKINPKWIDQYNTWLIGAKCIKLNIQDENLALKAYLYYCERSFHIRKFEENELIYKFHQLTTDVKEDSLTYLINKIDINHENKLMIDLLKSAFDDTTIIKYFIKVYDNYKSFNKDLYYFNGNFWIKGDTKYIIFDIDSMYDDLNKFLPSLFKDEDLYNKSKMLLKLRSVTYKKTLIEGIIGYVSVDKDLWDLNIDLLGFQNGVYDLKQGIFRNGVKEDYISLIIDYDYKESTPEEFDNVMNHFNKIMPFQEEKDLLLLLLSTCLSGRHLEKFIVCTGKGSNSKDALFTYLLTATLGPYYYRLNNTAITQKIKGDQSVSIASMNKKRCVVTSEPRAEDKVQTAFVKELTGSKSISYRGLYSNDTHVNLHETLFMLCNDKPDLDKSDEAIKRRLIVLPFRSTFKPKEDMDKYDLVEGENNVFIADEDVKSDSFLNKMKLPLMNVLLHYYQKFKADGYLIQSLPKSIIKLNDKYLEISDEFMNWFNTVYKKTTNKKKYVKISDVYENYKISDYYMNLTKEQKRKNNKSKFVEMIENNVNLKIFYKSHYKDDYDTITNKYNINVKTVLTNYIIRQEDDKDDEESKDDDEDDKDDENLID